MDGHSNLDLILRVENRLVFQSQLLISNPRVGKHESLDTRRPGERDSVFKTGNICKKEDESIDHLFLHSFGS